MEIYYEFERIARMLKHDETINAKDITAFNSFAKGRITIEECLKRFKNNNKISESYNINVDLFRRWLASLGYVEE